VGNEVERLVHGFDELHWKPDAIAQLSERASSLDEQTRKVVTIRLANELEDTLDQGLLLAAKGASPVRAARLAGAAGLADALGLHELGGELRAAQQELEHGQAPPGLRRPATGSFRQDVPSPPSRPFAPLRRLLSRSVGSLRHGMGRPGSTE
jgi:hypothetical protein